MNKPTPAQAKALRELARESKNSWDKPRIDIWFGFPGDERKVKAIRNENIRNGIKIRKATAQILFDNGWIENQDSDYYVISDLGRAYFKMLDSEDFISKPNKKPIWKTTDILDALYEKYRIKNRNTASEYIYFAELGDDPIPSRRIDFWSMSCWNSKNYTRTSYEIKVYRSDFLKEKKNLDKSKFALSMSNEYYFVTPPGLIKKEELELAKEAHLAQAGLIELNGNGRLKVVLKAPRRYPNFNLTWSLMASIGRQGFKRMIWEQEQTNNEIKE